MNNLLVNNKVTSCLPKIPSNTKSLLKDKQVNTGIKLLNIIYQTKKKIIRQTRKVHNSYSSFQYFKRLKRLNHNLIITCNH